MKNFNKWRFLRKPNFFLLSLLALLTCSSVSAQFTVSGTIIDEGEPLIGVTILVNGTTTGTVSDINGKYSLEIPDANQVLSFTYTGYILKEIPVAGRSVIDVTMEENATTMDEVIVVGYGKVSRRDLTGAVSSVKGDDLTKIQSISFEQGLAARAPGVQVNATEGGPGAGVKIRIRGGTSINASSDPLYVVDGFPISSTGQRANAGLGNSTTSPLATIDPADIESIEILKDASATAIYGSRGANGVVLITTKSGKKGKAQTSYETYFGVSEIARDIDLLSPQEYVDFWNEYYPYNPNDPNNQYSAQYRDALGNVIQLDDDRIQPVDWSNEVFRRATVQSHRFSISGGTDKTNYAGSFNFVDQNGIIETSEFGRIGGNLKLDHKVSDRITTGLNLNMGVTNRGGIISAASEGRNGRNGVITNMTLFSPVQGRVRYPEAQYDENGILLSTRDGDVLNPKSQIKANENTNQAFNAFANVYGQIELMEGLTFRSSFGTNIYTSKRKSWASSELGWGRNVNGIGVIVQDQNLGWLNENTLSYDKKLNANHRFNAVVGYTEQFGRYEFLRLESQNFPSPYINLDALGSAKQTQPNSSSASNSGLRSFLGRVNYTLSEKYLFTLTGRRDGSSKFAKGKKWSFFPSAAFAWRLGEENFIQSINAISSAKFRLSYGQSGNQGIPTDRSISSYDFSTFGFSDGVSSAVALNRLDNPELTWETTTQADVGFEFGLFNDRVYFNFDYYKKNTKNLLLNVPIPYTSGFDVSFQNLGEVENKGVELSLSTQNVVGRKFKWSTEFNISFNNNTVLNLGDANEFIVSSIGEHQNDYIVQVGQPLGSYYGFVFDGIYHYDDFVEFDGMTADQAKAVMDEFNRNDEMWFTPKEGLALKQGVSRFRPGMIKLKDVNNDGVVDTEDRTVLGSVQPDHYGSITNNFSYGRFDLSVFLTWSVGNDVYHNNLKRGMATAIPFFNKYGMIRDRWTAENPDAEVWAIWGGGDSGLGDDLMSYYIEDGSYLRVANVTLGYNLPPSFLKKIRLKSVRIYGGIDNLHVFTNYRGFDPDVSVGTNPLTPGLDWDAYPRMRTYRAGLNVGF